MDFSFPPIRLRTFHGGVRRLLTGTVAAALLVVAVPAPATAAPTPSVTITDVTVTEGTGGTVSANFTIQAAPAPKPGAGLQVSWATASGSATAPADFTAASGTVSLTKNAPSKVVSVSVVGDALNETNETFVVNLTNLVGSPGKIGDAQGVATITDNDPVPVLSVNDVSVTEGNALTTTAMFTVTLSAASGRAVTFNWATTAGSATAGTDYVAASGSRTIAAGTTTASIGIIVNGDFSDELDETFGIALSNPGNATIGDGSGRATITDDDPVPVLSVNDVSVSEGNSGTTTATFTLTLSAASGKSVTFDWATAAGSATVGTDYVAGSGSKTIAAGSTTATVGITVNGDVVDEVDETFAITLSNSGNATIADGSGQATITDDDAAPTLSVDDVTVTEGNAGTTNAIFTVSMSSVSANPVTFDWATAPGSATAGTDYVGASGSRTIAAGVTTATVTVTVNGDALDETDETYDVRLSNPGNATIADGSGLGTITDDDPAPTLSVNDITVTEGDAGTKTATFTVALSAASGQAVTFDWATTAGSATVGTDYVAASGSPTIAGGSTTATVGITVIGDPLDELDETFGITLSNPGNATIADGSGQGTITDDDAAPTLSVNDVTVTEGDAGTKTATFTVTLSAASGKTVTVDWATANDSATQPSDYAAGSDTLTFVPGDTSEPIVITVNGDTLDEINETFDVTLSNPGNATIADGSGLGTITDDDPLPQLSIGDTSVVVEGDAGITTATFTVALSAASGIDVTVGWATSDGSATQLADYVSDSGTLTFPAGTTTRGIGVTVNGDTTAELDETFTVNLSGATNATISDGSGVGTIPDDEFLPVIGIDDPVVFESATGTTSLIFDVTLFNTTALPTSVQWATSAGTAVAGVDYLDDSGTITFQGLATPETVQVPVTVYGDSTYERNETVMVNLTNAMNATIGDTQGIGTITNDDRAPTSLTLRVIRKPRAVVAKGILEPATSGERVTVTLLRKKGGKFVKLAAKTVSVRYLKDRDGDGKTDGSYTATFLRPKTKGSYKVLTRFKGTSSYKPRNLGKIFTLAIS
jgi:Calx-beta domain-containing protein